MTEDSSRKSPERIRRAVEILTATANAVTAAGISYLVPGVGGQLIGSSAGQTLESVVIDVADRALSKREAERVVTALSVATDVVHNRILKGDELRNDGFMRVGEGKRAPSEEIAEGAVTVAQREWEAKKIPFLGRLMGNLNFKEYEGIVDGAFASQLVHLLDRLSYRQLCMLALFGSGFQQQNLRSTPLDPSTASASDISAHQELLDLYRLTLIQQGNANGDGGDILLEIFTIVPARVRVVTGIGVTLSESTQVLASVPAEDLASVAIHFR